MTSQGIRLLSGLDIVNALPLSSAVAAIERVLRDGFDPAADPARSVVGLRSGQFFFMPSETESAVGAKVAIVRNNPAPGVPAVSATYLLFDPSTLSLTTVFDGSALTARRTPAVSVAAIRPALDRYIGPVNVLVFGAGPQARGHVDAIRQCTAARVAEVSFVVRRPGYVTLDLAAGETVRSVDDPLLPGLLAEAAIVVCATSARMPLFNSALLRDDVTVIAVGSHQPDARELDSAIMARGQVVVEDIATALRESGDVVIAMDEGALSMADLIPMRLTVQGEHHLELDRPVVFKGSGMSWQDLAVAQAMLSALKPLSAGSTQIAGS